LVAAPASGAAARAATGAAAAAPAPRAAVSVRVVLLYAPLAAAGWGGGGLLRELPLYEALPPGHCLGSNFYLIRRIELLLLSPLLKTKLSYSKEPSPDCSELNCKPYYSRFSILALIVIYKL
jgi:hypothetical protein